MIQPAAHVGNKIFKNPLEIFIHSPKDNPLAPTGAAVGYKKNRRANVSNYYLIYSWYMDGHFLSSFNGNST